VVPPSTRISVNQRKSAVPLSTRISVNQ
jgi:hypothetical protein